MANDYSMPILPERLLIPLDDSKIKSKNPEDLVSELKRCFKLVQDAYQGLIDNSKIRPAFISKGTQPVGPGSQFMIWNDNATSKKYLLYNNNGTIYSWLEGINPDIFATIVAVQSGSYVTGTTTGSPNDYLVSLTPNPPALSNDMTITVTPNFTNTGAATLQVNSYTAYNIKKIVNGTFVDIAAGDVVDSISAIFIYNLANTVWVLINPVPYTAVFEDILIGDLYLTTTYYANSAAVAAAKGYGTWSIWGSGRMPVGVDTGQTEFDTVEKTGGTKTKNIAHYHTGPDHYHSTPNHYHGLANSSNIAAAGSSGYYMPQSNTYNSNFNTNNSGTGNTGNAGSTIQDVLNPYITCYIWKRMA